MAKRFGDYEILEELGRGGMGTVYKARQVDLDRIVALKMLHPGVASPETLARFQREAKVLGKLRHPNIVRLLSVGEESGRCYLTMDFIEGDTLSELIARSRTRDERRRLVRYLAVVARAVHFAHSRGIIHRDLKPSNVIIDAEGTPFITDFGLAKELGVGQTVTLSGATVGTATYMAPEQAEGRGEAIGPKTDVYALGAILYEVLAGRPPFQGATGVAVLHKVCRDTPRPPRQLNRSVRRGLERICLKCLEKDPADRYPSAEALAIDFERHLARGGAGWRRGWAARFLRAIPQRPRIAALVGAAAALVVLIAYAWTGSYRSRQTVQQGADPSSRVSQGPPSSYGGSSAGAKIPFAPLAHASAVINSYHASSQVTCIAVVGDEVWVGSPGGAYRLGTGGERRFFFPTKSEVRGMAGEGAGVVWLATAAHGAFSYDGRSWRTYTARDGLLSNEVNSVAIGPDGRKWFGTARGVCSFDGSRWRDHTPRDKPRQHWGFKSLNVKMVFVDPEGVAWFAGVTDGWSGERILASVSGDRIRLHRCDRASETNEERAWLESYGGRPPPRGPAVYAMASEGRSGRWFATSRGVGYLDCLSSPQDRHGGARDLQFVHRDERRRPMIFAVAVDRDGRKWLGTARGVLWYDGTGPAQTETGRPDGRAGRLPPVPDPPSGLRQALIAAIAVDSRGRKWFGGRAGLWCFDGRAWAKHDAGTGLPDSQVFAIAVDPRGHKWFATRRGVCSFNGGTWRVHASTGDGSTGYTVSVIVDQQQKETIESGLPSTSRVLDRSDRRNHAYCLIVTPSVVRGRGYRVRPSLPAAHDQMHWMRETGLRSSGWEAVFSHVGRQDGERYDVARKIAVRLGWVAEPAAFVVDMNGIEPRTWRSHKRGLSLGRQGETREHRLEHGIRGLGDRVKVFDIAVNTRGAAWVATDRGVFYVGEETIHHFSADDGLAHDLVRAVVIDEHDRVWFGTLDGVTCFDGSVWRTWRTDDLLAGNDVLSLAVDLDGSMWVGTTSGVSHIVLRPKD